MRPDGTAAIARVRVQGGPEDGREVVVKGSTDPENGLPLQVTFRFQGDWHNHERHGRQFQFSSYTKVVPHDRRGVLAYLTSTVDGVGARARPSKLWDAFGGDAVRVLREEPQKVMAAGILSQELATDAACSSTTRPRSRPSRSTS